MKRKPKEAQLCYLRVTVLPSGHIIHQGKVIGYYALSKDWLIEGKDIFKPLMSVLKILTPFIKEYSESDAYYIKKLERLFK